MRQFLIILAMLVLPIQALAAELGDDGLHKTDWMRETFKDLGEDLAEAQAEGKALLVLIEQRGCIYCKRMHEEVFVQPEIDQFIRDNFFVVQLNMFGDIEVTDFDGATLSEKEMVSGWGQSFTPTMMFFPGEVAAGLSAPEAAIAVIPGALEAAETMSLLMWASDAEVHENMGLKEFHAQRIDG